MPIKGKSTLHDNHSKFFRTFVTKYQLRSMMGHETQGVHHRCRLDNAHVSVRHAEKRNLQII